MNEIYQGILAVSSYIIIFGLIGKLIRDHLNVTEPILATIYGIVLGPDVTGIFTTDPVISKRFLFALSRIVLSFQIMTISLQLPNVYVYKKMRSLFVLLFPASLLSALIVFLLVYFFFTKYDLVTSWAIASACTPTDPVLSSSIMKGEFANTHIPERIRLLLAAESGLNDGVGIVFIYLILSRRNTFFNTVNTYFVNAIVLKTLTAGITGYLTGLIFGIALKFCHSRRFVARNSVTVFGIALSLFCMCLAIFLNQSELIFIFFTGIAFSKSEWFVLETRGSQFQLLVESVFNISFLIFFGSRINWNLLNFPTFLVSLSILLLRRPLAILCLYKYIPVIHTKKDAFILAWFGPIGVGSLYYAVITDMFLKTDTVEFISFLMVFSVFLHGLSVPIFIFFRYLVDNFYKFRNREEVI